MANALTIGPVAKLTGMTAKTIRYYEAAGIVPAAVRTAAGYRHYDNADVDRLRFVQRARALGLPLRRLKLLTKTLDGAPPQPLRRRLQALVREQLLEVGHQIAALESVRRELRRVSKRMGVRPRRRRGDPCQCLDTSNG